MVLLFFFSGRDVGPWDARCFCFVFFVFVCLSVRFVYCSIRSSSPSELKNIRRDADQVAGVRNRRASISLTINRLKTAKINNTRFGRIENALWKG